MFLDIQQPEAQQEAKHPGARVRAIVQSRGYDPLQVHMPVVLLELEEGGQTKPREASSLPAANTSAEAPAAAATSQSATGQDSDGDDLPMERPATSAARSQARAQSFVVSGRSRGMNFHRSAAGESLQLEQQQQQKGDTSSAPPDKRQDSGVGEADSAHQQGTIGTLDSAQSPGREAKPSRATPPHRSRRKPGNKGGSDASLPEASDTELSDVDASANKGRRLTAGQVGASFVQREGALNNAMGFAGSRFSSLSLILGFP